MKAHYMNYLKIARFDHWIKQLFIFPGVYLAFVMVNKTGIQDIIIKLLLGFFSTCAAASANYCINEWLDMEFDRFHPVKKHRPFVSENLSVPVVLTEYAFFFLIALFLAWFVSLIIFILILVLLVLGILYNVKPIRTKDLPYVDVLSESLNNAVRFLIGWFIITNIYLPPISFVFGYWMGGSFLMAAKRFAEYRMIGDLETARLYRKSFGRYSELELLLSTIFYGFLSLFFCGVFLIKYKVELLIIIPFICLLFCYYIRICFKSDSSAQKPEKLFREKRLMLLCVIIIVMFIVLCSVKIHKLDFLLNTDLIEFPTGKLYVE